MKSLLALGTLVLTAAILLTGCGNGSKEAGNGNNGTNSVVSDAVSAEENKTGAQSSGAEAVSADEESGGDAKVTAAIKSLVDDLKKGAESGQVDWDALDKTYSEHVKPLVQQRDAEAQDQVDEQLTAAAAAGRNGELEPAVVAQLFDKLLQKIAFLQLRHDFKEANSEFADKEKVKHELEEAHVYYDGLLKGMVEKRDAAYGTQLTGAIDGGFAEMQQAAGKGDNLAYNLGKQVIDKTLMKAFYLATGADKGYGYKVEAAVKEGKTEEAKVEQAEGWAFFQSLKGYLESQDADAVELIEGRFNLANDPKEVKGDEINQTYIRALSATALSEYGETFDQENWGKDKSVITALEGALFIDMLSLDLPKTLGSPDKALALTANSQQLLEQVKAGKKAEAEATFKLVEADLKKMTAYGLKK